MATAIANYYVRVQDDFGGTNDPRLIPLLGCLLELIPWVQQWHNDPNPDFNGLRMGDYYLSFVTDEAQQLGKTLDDIRNWQPPASPKKLKKANESNDTKLLRHNRKQDATSPILACSPLYTLSNGQSL